MDQGLFKKYTIQIQKNKDIQEDIRLFILEKTNISIEEKELQITKKIITIQTSSVKKSLLIQKKIKNLLQEKGYLLKI
jgi:hypothetical protein